MTAFASGDSGDADLNAAEFVLGTLPNNERSALEARLSYYPRWRVLVGRWSERLQPFADAVAPVEPPPALRARIMAAAVAVPFGGRTRPASRSIWRVGSWLSAAAALLIAAVLLWPQAPSLTKIAFMGNTTTPAIVTVVADATHSQLMISAGLPLPPNDKNFELWVIPSDGTPRSLGLLAGAIETPVKLPEDLRTYISKDSILAISVEPVGGSPTGQPTGPVVYTGRIVSATRG